MARSYFFQMEEIMEERKRVQLFCDDPSRTKQSFKDDVDINNIIKKFQKSGQLPMNNFRVPGKNVDLSGAVDFHAAMNTVRVGERLFAGLSATVRKRFNNSPEQFLSFMEDPKNKDEAIKLGLVKPPIPVPGPLKVEVVNPEAPAPVDGKAKPA